MLELVYKHPLHGKKYITCYKIVYKFNALHVLNFFDETFLTIEAERIVSITAKEE